MGLMKEALFYSKEEGGKVRCQLCRHRCLLEEGKKGICGVRENRDGRLISLVYERPCTWHVDPIEKKPLFHFFPRSKAFSIATVGCNFQCSFCQNHDISQMPRDEGRIEGFSLSVSEVVDLAERNGCKSISFTYTEPTIFYEYALEVSKLAKQRGMYNNFVTNGYIEAKPLEHIRPYLDAANIDLKSFREEFYRRLCKASLKEVLESIKVYKALGIWIEITTLIIPGLNDGEEEIRGIARFIREELGKETPWHVTAFFPRYRLLDRERTKEETLKIARAIGLEEGLRYVYEGNVLGSEGEYTFCFNCKRPVIKRYGFLVTEYNRKRGSCAFCGAKIDGVGL